jgi:hypothetical protein
VFGTGAWTGTSMIFFGLSAKVTGAPL